MQTRVAWARLRHRTRLLSQLQPQVTPFSPAITNLQEAVHRDARAIAVRPDKGEKLFVFYIDVFLYQARRFKDQEKLQTYNSEQNTVYGIIFCVCLPIVFDRVCQSLQICEDITLE